ncbi:MAG TPA: histidine phosphatase family protein [Mycobacteriales bacterium]|nr:histidine phosphatase family protein [Mycobacteriales bacterium]
MSGPALAGGVVWGMPDGEIAVALDGDRLPRGEVGAAEHPVSAAHAAVAQIADHAPVLGARLPRQQRDGRRFDYWEMQLRQDAPRLRWFSPADALERLPDPADRKAVRRFGGTPRPDSTILLVRHALAGRKSRWHGPDEQRPLDAVGTAQAQRLRDTLPYWSPGRIVSAEKLRCVQTVEPLAAALSLPIEHEPVLTEDCNEGEAFPAITRIEELAAEGSTAVICSQGGVIPTVVAALHVSAGLPLPSIRAKKASTWVLQFAAGHLIHADYYPDFAGAKT